LRGRGTHAEQWVAPRCDACRRLVILRGEVPDHAADRSQQENEADYAPNDRATRWTVANQFFVRPVLCIADVFAGAIRARCPSRPPEESCHLAFFGAIGQCAGRDRVFIPSFAINIGIVRRKLVEGSSTVIVDNDAIGGHIIRIVASDFGESALESRALFGGQGRVVSEAFRPRPAIENDHRLTVEVIGAPIWSNISAVPPDRSDFLTSGRLPDILSVANGFASEQYSPVGCYDLARDGWSIADCLITHTAENGEGDQHDQPECDP